jgi:hypothetical protein
VLGWQGFKFETRLNNKQPRELRIFAGACRSSTTRLLLLTKNDKTRKRNAYAHLAPKHALAAVELLAGTVAESSTDTRTSTDAREQVQEELGHVH